MAGRSDALLVHLYLHRYRYACIGVLIPLGLAGLFWSQTLSRLREFPVLNAVDYRTVRQQIQDLLARRDVSLGSCPVALDGCVSVTNAGSQAPDAYVLPDGPVTTLPGSSELNAHNFKYIYSWAPITQFSDGDSYLSRLVDLSTRLEPLACEGATCSMVVRGSAIGDQADDGRLSLCLAPKVGTVIGPPVSACQPLSVTFDGETWLRGVVGWGTAGVAEELGSPAAPIDPGDVAFTYRVSHSGSFDRRRLVQALEAQVSRTPLNLASESSLADASASLRGVRRFEVSEVLRPIREWVSLNVHLSFEGAELTVIQGTVTLLVDHGNTGDLSRYRPAEGADEERYLKAVRDAVKSGLGRLCAGEVSADAIQCR